MNLKRSASILLMALFLTAAAAGAATIYTWTDENGVLHMTNVPPVEAADNLDVRELEPPSMAETPEVQYALPQEQATAEDAIEVEIIDDHVIVPVLLVYKGREVNARLLLDTGSTNITLHREIAAKLLIRESQKGSIRVAGGEVIDAEAVRLDAVTVGKRSKKNLLAGVIENRGPKVPFDGLLGMNFLKDYQYSIDFQDRVLRWHE